MSRKQPSPRRLRLGTAAVAAVLTLAGCGELDATSLLARAQEAADENQYRAAIIDLRNAVASEPENAEARYRLAEMALLLGDAATAEKELRRARQLGYPAAETVLPMARALIALEREDDALAELEAIDPPTAAAEALRGLAFEQADEPEEALAAYRRALAIAPDNRDALLGRARFAMETGDRAGARSSYERALAAHGESPQVALEYGRFLYSAGQVTEAAAVFTEALDRPLARALPALRWDLLVSLAEAQITVQSLEEAEQTIAMIDEMRPDDVLVKYLRARVAFERDDLALANELVARALVEAPLFDSAQMLQAKVHLARGEYVQADMFLRRLAARDPEDAQARELLVAAQRAIETQRAAEAGRSLTEADLLALRGGAKSEMGDIDSALAFWERALEKDPDNQDVKLELLNAYIYAGDLDKARALLDQTQWESAPAQLRVALVDAMLTLREGDPDAARRKAAASAERFPEAAAIPALQGVMALTGDPARARPFFVRSLELDPDYATAAVNLAFLDDRQGNTAQGLARLEAFLEEHPQDPVALSGYASLQLRNGDRAGARATLEEALEADEDAIPVRLRLAGLLLEDGDVVAAERVARELIRLNPAMPTAHRILGASLLGQGKSEAGAESLRTALRLAPDGVDTLRTLVRAEMAMGNFAQAQQTVDQLLQFAPDDPLALETDARLALRRGNLDEGEAKLARLEAAAPEAAAYPILVMRGDIAEARGEFAQALDHFERAFALRPNAPLTERVFKMRQQLGRDDAEAVLTDWLARHPADDGVRLILAQSAQQRGETARAITEYERILRTHSDNLVAWNNVALAYQEQGKYGQAVSAAQRALDLAPDNPIVQDTYGWALVQAGQVEDGVAMLRDAWAAAPGTGDIGYHLAVGLARRGAAAEAAAILREALAGERQFAARAEAQALLDSL